MNEMLKKTAPERATKTWWVSSEDTVRQALGYSCAPANPDVWWFPEIGYSMNEAHYLHTSEKAAIRKALTELRKERRSLDSQIRTLETRAKAL
jgi:hypothetical protein